MEIYGNTTQIRVCSSLKRLLNSWMDTKFSQDSSRKHRDAEKRLGLSSHVVARFGCQSCFVPLLRSFRALESHFPQSSERTSICLCRGCCDAICELCCCSEFARNPTFGKSSCHSLSNYSNGWMEGRMSSYRSPGDVFRNVQPSRVLPPATSFLVAGSSCAPCDFPPRVESTLVLNSGKYKLAQSNIPRHSEVTLMILRLSSPVTERERKENDL